MSLILSSSLVEIFEIAIIHNPSVHRGFENEYKSYPWKHVSPHRYYYFLIHPDYFVFLLLVAKILFTLHSDPS